MRVALIGHKQIPGRTGGVEVVVEELAIRLASLGIDVLAYNRKLKGNPSPKGYKGVRLIDIPTFDTKKLNAVVYSYLATVRSVIDGCDIIHYHALGPSAALWLAKLAGKRVVVTVHGLNYKTPKWKGFGAKYIKFGERISMKRADEVIVLSQSIQKYFEHEYGRVCTYLPNGLSMPEEVEDDSVLDRLNLRNRNYVLCVSRTVPGKGLETLIKAYRATQTDAQLVIVGDAEYVEEFKAYLYKLAAEDPRIRFVGFIAKPDLCALYSAARLFVLPSEAEGMPMSLLEAMWFECPCLVSDIPENTEVLKGNGWTFNVGDEGDLTKKLTELTARFPARLATRRIVRAGHDWNQIAEKTKILYERVLT